MLYVDDLAHVWCQWAEMEVKHRNFKSAIALLARAVAAPPPAPKSLSAEELKVRRRVHSSNGP